MASRSKLCFFTLAKSKFNKNNLKTQPSYDLSHLNSTLIYPNFKSELEFIERNEKEKSMKSNMKSSYDFPKKNIVTNSNKNSYNHSIELSTINSQPNLNLQNCLSLS